MRRGLAISLLLLLVSSAFAPLLALDADAQGTLLACCRRNGVHHCEMAATSSSLEPGSQVQKLQSRCPAGLRVHARTLQTSSGFTPAHTAAVQLAAQPAIRRRAETARRIAFSRTRQKRGPPSVPFS